MKSRKLRNGLLAIALFALVGVSAYYGLKKNEKEWAVVPMTETVDGDIPSTEMFIRNYMKNPNGTLATYLMEGQSGNPDIVGGREALSESLGLWMQYAVAKKDEAMFNNSAVVLTERFLTSDGYIAWKLQKDGTRNVTANALGDDLRIVDNLLQAAELWSNDAYRSLAAQIAKELIKSVTHNGYLVDFRDFSTRNATNILSLVYVDTSALKRMRDSGLIDGKTYDKHVQVLLELPNDGTFYPKTYQVETKQYAYDDTVNLIDQLIVALHSAKAGKKPVQLTAFLKNEFEKEHRLMGRYDRRSKLGNAAFESSSVYGLTVLLALELGDRDWASQLLERMLELRDQDKTYPGGYVFNGNTHMFDNLFPLLAETALRQSGSQMR